MVMNDRCGDSRGRNGRTNRAEIHRISISKQGGCWPSVNCHSPPSGEGWATHPMKAQVWRLSFIRIWTNRHAMTCATLRTMRVGYDLW